MEMRMHGALPAHTEDSNIIPFKAEECGRRDAEYLAGCDVTFP